MKPLLRAGAATAGTFVVIGGATLATASVVMTVVRAAVNHRKVWFHDLTGCLSDVIACTDVRRTELPFCLARWA